MQEWNYNVQIFHISYLYYRNYNINILPYYIYMPDMKNLIN
jgi:hypothetical protein